MNFRGFRRFLIYGNSSCVVLCTQWLRYNICSAWFCNAAASEQSTTLYNAEIRATLSQLLQLSITINNNLLLLYTHASIYLTLAIQCTRDLLHNPKLNVTTVFRY